ncbi:MAG: hypothetical protein JWM12_2323, partial [Ilumatobacteraceae bacterium]|nr:hypothetical protein [Ilumatobacteraceae bacterium]
AHLVKLVGDGSVACDTAPARLRSTFTAA